MTREEASNILWWASKRHYPGDQMDITAEDIEAFDMAIAALRSLEAVYRYQNGMPQKGGIKTSPCDNCIGPMLAITHGYKSMKIRDTEVEE